MNITIMFICLLKGILIKGWLNERCNLFLFIHFQRIIICNIIHPLSFSFKTRFRANKNVSISFSVSITYTGSLAETGSKTDTTSCPPLGVETCEYSSSSPHTRTNCRLFWIKYVGFWKKLVKVWVNRLGRDEVCGWTDADVDRSLSWWDIQRFFMIFSCFVRHFPKCWTCKWILCCIGKESSILINKLWLYL